MKTFSEYVTEAKGKTEADVNAAALILLMKFKNHRMASRYGDIQDPEKSPFHKSGRLFSIRDWGKWEVPDDEEDDGDYDWEEPTKETVKAANDLVKQFNREKKPMNASIEEWGEKNWLYVLVK